MRLSPLLLLQYSLVAVSMFSCTSQGSGNGLYLEITSPRNGSTVSDSPIEVRGEASPLIADVWVQDVPAKLEAGVFRAPAWLEPGKNVITAKGWARDGRSTHTSVTVYLSEPDADGLDQEPREGEDAISYEPDALDAETGETNMDGAAERFEPPTGCGKDVQLEYECRSLEGLYDRDLISALHDMVSRGYRSLGYDTARSRMYQDIDLVGDRIECVYTGTWVFTGGGMPDSKEMNCEHTWPQSKGAGSEPARSDLHHLFPTIPQANSARSNYDFGWVADTDPDWAMGGSKLGHDYSGQVVFEVRDAHKGDTARAILYFSVRYEYHVPDKEEEVMREWHFLDPPDDYEKARNDAIEEYQHNRNPFVDCPSLVCFIDDF